MKFLYTVYVQYMMMFTILQRLLHENSMWFGFDYYPRGVNNGS